MVFIQKFYLLTEIKKIEKKLLKLYMDHMMLIKILMELYIDHFFKEM